MADWGPYYSELLCADGVGSPTPNASSNTKGSWSTCSGATPTRSEGIYLCPAWFGADATCRSVLVDVGFGAGPTIVINNLMLCPPHANHSSVERMIATHTFFPVSFPPGEDIKIRAQSNKASHSAVYLYARPMVSGLPCAGSIVDTYGADTTNSKGTTVTGSNSDGVYGSWTELVASSERVNALMVCVGHGQADWATYGNQWGAVAIGVGGAGSEQEIIRLLEISTGNGFRIPSQQWFGPYYVTLPPGTRISARVCKQYTSSSQRTFDVIVYGIR